MTKPLMDLPMNTRSENCGCGGPPKTVAVDCPHCGEKGLRVKAGTVRYHLKDEFRSDATEKIYGLCLSDDCPVTWYGQEGTHHFTLEHTDTPIWTKNGADPVYACYCNKITREMVERAVSVKGLRTVEEITAHYADDPRCTCATSNPSGQCCEEFFQAMIGEALREYLKCNC